MSIALPVYNGERYLAATLDSILAQTYRDFELIIGDNASTDGTAEIARRYAAADARIRLVLNPRNMGAAWNFRNVTALAVGDYVKHAAHDDLLAPTYLERCVAALDADASVVLAYPLSVHIDENGRRLPFGPGGAYRVRLDLRSPRPHERFRDYHHNCNETSGADPVFGVIRSDAMAKTSVIGSYIGADLILLGELCLLGKFVEIPEELFFYRLHPSNSVRSNPGREGRGAWFDPRNAGRLRNQLFHWEWLLRYLRAIQKTPMSFVEKLGCYRQMPRWVWRHRGRLLGDLVAGGAFLVRGGAVRGASGHLDRVTHGSPTR